jgi:hypothetical protein
MRPASSAFRLYARQISDVKRYIDVLGTLCGKNEFYALGNKLNTVLATPFLNRLNYVDIVASYRLTIMKVCVHQLIFMVECFIDFPPNIRAQSGRLSLRRIARVRSTDGAAICTLRGENCFYSCTTQALKRGSVKCNMSTGLTAM